MSAQHFAAMPGDATFRIGEWQVDPSLDEIVGQGRTIKLEPRTMRLLLRLAQSAGQVVSAQQLLDAVWSGVIVGPASVYQAVSQLRKILGDTEPTPTYIATVPRKGYRLIASVQPITPLPEQTAPVTPGPPASPLLERRAAQVERRAARPRTPPVTLRWGIAIGIALCAIAVLATVFVQHRWSSPPADVSLVVLPFTDMTAGKADEAFCDGLTEELSSTLSRLPSLHIVSQTSAFSFRHSPLDVREIGRRLSATHALEGSVRRSGDSLRVTTQLVDTAKGYRRWSETYDVPISDLLRLQQDIARAVARELEIRFPEDNPALARKAKAVNPEAYQLYLLGRHYYRQRTREANERVIELNSRAIALDRSFARAYVGLAAGRLNEHALAGKPLNELSAEIESLTQTALRLDPSLSEAYATRGMLRADLNRFADARQDLRRAIELDANNVPALAGLGRLYGLEAMPLLALQTYDRTVRLDPLDFMHRTDRCSALLDLGRFAPAEEDCSAARRLQPDSDWAFIASSWLSRAQGHLAQSLRLADAAARLAPARVDIQMARIDLMLDLGMPEEAGAAARQALVAFNDDLGLKLLQVDVALSQRGSAAARAVLSKVVAGQTLEPTDSVLALEISVAVEDYDYARNLAARLIAAPDLPAIRAEDEAALKWGSSYRLPLAWLQLHDGNRPGAEKYLAELLASLTRLEANGYTNWGIHWLRAQSLGMMGDADGAIRSLRRAADSGWRGPRIARQDPYLSSLSGRADFQNLLSEVDALVETERRSYREVTVAVPVTT